jgi:heptosyltransferase III
LFPEDASVADGPALNYNNILIVRTDRIGDVVLTLPMIQVLRKNFPLAKISFLVRSYTRDIVEGQPGLNAVLLYDDAGKLKSLWTLFFEVRDAKFDLAIVAFPRFRVALLLWLSRVKMRVGSGYRWYSFFFNNRVYEHRKTAEKHEFEYNLSLLSELGCDVDPGVKPIFAIHADALIKASNERKRLGLTSGDIVAILHPGSGGSARDWSPKNFSLLAQKFAALGWKVVITGAKEEEEMVRSVVVNSGVSTSFSVGNLSLGELAAFISLADLFVSNSTGPLHIAAAVGTPVIAFYPPIVACSPQRWGPVTEKKILFVPEVSQCELCHGSPCRSNVCMDQIDVEQVVDAAIQLVKREKKTRTSNNIPAFL